MGLLSPKSAFRAVREASHRSHAPTLIGLAAVLWLVVAGIAVALLYGERKEVLKRATRSAAGLVSVLEAHTGRTYQAVDITLAGVAGALRLAPELKRNDPVFQRALEERLQALQPYVRAIFVIGPGGRLLHDTNYPITPDVSAGDRLYFKAHREDAALEGALWPPLRSLAGRGWFLAVTRRVADDARFRGIVVASLEPQYFEALFSRLGLASADTIALYHRDGTLIARYPHREDQVGKSFVDSEIFARRLPQAASGTYITSSGMFSFERVVSFRALQSVPLVVAMNQGTQSILEGWRESALGAALALGAFALLLGALIAQFLRQQRIRELASERRMQSEKLEALGHLTGSVSHDFANLLNVVSASLRVIQLEPPDAERIRTAVAVGERAVVRGSQLVDRLRAFSRNLPLQVQSTDLNTLITAGVELLHQATGQHVKLETELGAGVARCLLDESELEVALVNLLVNAKDAGASRIVLKTFNFTEQARPAGWHGEHAADYVCLSVTDDGRGMSEEVRRRVFEPYFSTKGRHGTGLGLAQVYGFLRQTGGDVHIESHPGKGTAVHLLFRRTPDESLSRSKAAARGIDAAA